MLVVRRFRVGLEIISTVRYKQGTGFGATYCPSIQNLSIEKGPL